LLREDLFTVVHEHFLTDTARLADIVLPATTQFEHFDVQGAWGHHYVAVNLPAIAPVGEARSGGALMRGLAHQLGLNHPALQESDEEIARSCLPEGWTLEALKASGWRKLSPPRPEPVHLEHPLSLAVEPIQAPAPLAADKLQLLTPKSHYFLNSTFANMPRQRRSQGLPTIEIGPRAASRRGLSGGDTVIVRSGSGELRLSLKVGESVPDGLAFLEGKWWAVPDDATAPANLLSDRRWSPKGQPAYNEIFVTIEAAGSDA
jgi:anaerobic selenocysteine-containing dehydrogenase